jgi:hypothetical protein
VWVEAITRPHAINIEPNGPVPIHYHHMYLLDSAPVDKAAMVHSALAKTSPVDPVLREKRHQEE